MDPAPSQQRQPLRWREALRRVLALLEFGAEAPSRAFDPDPEELEVLRLAGLGPLLAEAMAGHPGFPALFAEEVLNRERVATHRRVLSSLLDRLEGRGEPPILFKGMAACDALYERPSLRVFTDIDLLIPAGDLAAWDRAILDLGGLCTDARTFGTRRFSARHYFQHTYAIPAGSEGGQVDLDLHLSFGPREQYPVDHARAAVGCRPSEDGRCLLLSPAQWICALAIHQVRTLFVWSYQDYVDLFQILRRGEVDDTTLRSTAREFGAVKASAILLHHLEEALPEGSAVRVPRPVAALPWSHRAFEEQLDLAVSRRPEQPSFPRHVLRTAQLTDSMGRLLRYLVVYAAKRGLDLVVRS